MVRRISEDHVTIKDTSTNGTLLNGKRLQKNSEVGVVSKWVCLVIAADSTTVIGDVIKQRHHYYCSEER